MTDVLIVGDTTRSPELRHEVPLSVPDPFMYCEVNGTRHVVAHSMEVVRMAELPNLVAHPLEEFGYDEILRSGLSRYEIGREVRLRACRELGLTAAAVPATFPVDSADHLRANGIELRVDRDLFDLRRRVKNEAELAGIRRAQRATEAAMDAIRDLLRRAEQSNGSLTVDGSPLTSERLKTAIGEVFNAHNVSADDMIVSHGPQSAVGHDMGSGSIAPGEPIICDLYPRDRETGCYADMTRTFVVGAVSDELREYHRLCLEALQRVVADCRPDADCKALNAATCDIFEQAGYPTVRTKEQGKPLENGFYHGLGHGVGLDVHEQPTLGIVTDHRLMAGDVITVEPGLYRKGFGGVRLEDLVLVTEDGNENLTTYPYDLEP